MSNGMCPEIMLPKRTPPVEEAIHFIPSPMFPITKDITDASSLAKGQKNMDMVWHDDKAMAKKRIFLPIEPQAIHENVARVVPRILC